uniref:Uncharacterized protein n=1 Tax=Wuchereria bancrofti TaxID=6293 RepID=A0AAF5RTZ5_WUCBA
MVILAAMLVDVFVHLFGPLFWKYEVLMSSSVVELKWCFSTHVTPRRTRLVLELYVGWGVM